MANNNISQMGYKSGLMSGLKNKPNTYPWNVENSATAGDKWPNAKNYTRRLRSYANQGLQQYTEHPTAYTERMENDVKQQYADTINAQGEKADDQFKTNMARTGLSGQPVTAAQSAQLGYEKGKDMANQITDTHNKFEAQRQEDWEDWLNYVRAENNQDRQFKLERDKMAMQMAMFNTQRQDRKHEQGRFLNKIMPWAKMAGGLVGGLGASFPGENGGN